MTENKKLPKNTIWQTRFFLFDFWLSLCWKCLNKHRPKMTKERKKNLSSCAKIICNLYMSVKWIFHYIWHLIEGKSKSSKDGTICIHNSPYSCTYSDIDGPIITAENEESEIPKEKKTNKKKRDNKEIKAEEVKWKQLSCDRCQKHNEKNTEMKTIIKVFRLKLKWFSNSANQQ